MQQKNIHFTQLKLPNKTPPKQHNDSLPMDLLSWESKGTPPNATTPSLPEISALSTGALTTMIP